MTQNDSLQKATLGGGCFWCTEAIFQSVKGVHKVQSGYAGGKSPQPTYREVCSGTTDHAEVIQLTFDPRRVNFETLLRVFWATHDPTTINRQGADVGSQYRSIILYHDAEQKETAERVRRELDRSETWDHPIVTEIHPLDTFYPAEDYHQNYYEQNANQPYCAFVISPKLAKFRETFSEYLEARGD